MVYISGKTKVEPKSSLTNMISFQLSERRFLKVVTWRTNEDTWSPGLAYVAIHVYTPPCTQHSI